MRKINLRAFIWLIPAIIAAVVSTIYPLTQGPAAIVFFVSFIGFFHSRIPKRIPARKIHLISIQLGVLFGIIALATAGGIYDILSGVISDSVITVYAAPFYEEFLKASGVYVLALKNRKWLKSWRAAAICGLLGGLAFGVGEGLAQPSIYRPITAPLHALETMAFALGVRFMVVGKGRRDGVLGGVCMASAILSHMFWNAFAPLVLP
jgi:RsiW-degrading membrane proteinase PrsW (M82 family)